MSSLDDTPVVPVPRVTPLRIAGIYLLFGFSWILFSDTVLWLVTDDPAIRLQVEAVKGILFVLLSAGLLYWLSERARRTQLQARDRLQQQTRELSIFHRILRHNLRNIATVIGGRAEAARAEDELEPHLSIVERKADRLTTLAEKASLLRGISREDSAKRVRQDLSKAVSEICAQRRQDHPDATIVVESPECVETMVPARLGFAISELIENAIFHAGPSPEVHVTVEADRETVRVTVADDGSGLPDIERTAIEGDVEEVLDHSEGVGLWLVRLIIENVGGEVTVQDGDLGGTAVSLSFPRVDNASETPATS